VPIKEIKNGSNRLLLRTRGSGFALCHSLTCGLRIPHTSSLNVEEILSTGYFLPRGIFIPSTT
jgi:hypothetical protein